MLTFNTDRYVDLHAQTLQFFLLVFMQLIGTCYMVYKYVYAFFCVTDLKIDMKVVDRRRRYALCGHVI